MAVSAFGVTFVLLQGQLLQPLSFMDVPGGSNRRVLKKSLEFASR